MKLQAEIVGGFLRIHLVYENLSSHVVYETNDPVKVEFLSANNGAELERMVNAIIAKMEEVDETEE